MERPGPLITEENEAFWTGGREGRLIVTGCEDCGYRTHPPTPRCPSCFGDHVGPSVVSGRGHVYTFTINRRQWMPGLEVPYVIAVVELEEQPGLRLLTNIVDCPVDEVAIEMPVEVEFRALGEAFVPVFRRSAA